jgi:hypothetical protein
MGDRTQNYIVARKLLLDSADAVERIMLAQKQISELDGYVTRVTDMLVRVYPPLSICARHVQLCVVCVVLLIWFGGKKRTCSRICTTASSSRR